MHTTDDIIKAANVRLKSKHGLGDDKKIIQELLHALQHQLTRADLWESCADRLGRLVNEKPDETGVTKHL